MIYSTAGAEIRSIEKVIKINQKDLAQGHICPDVAKWLESGPAGLIRIVQENLIMILKGIRIFTQAF